MNTNLLLSSWGRQLGKKLMKINKKTKPYDCHKWNIVRGDFVRVIQGPQSGHDGKVLHVLRKQNRVIVEGVNMVISNYIDAFQWG
jgi:transcription antitermination factor NusG